MFKYCLECSVAATTKRLLTYLFANNTIDKWRSDHTNLHQVFMENLVSVIAGQTTDLFSLHFISACNFRRHFHTFFPRLTLLPTQCIHGVRPKIKVTWDFCGRPFLIFSPSIKPQLRQMTIEWAFDWKIVTFIRKEKKAKWPHEFYLELCWWGSLFAVILVIFRPSRRLSKLIIDPVIKSFNFSNARRFLEYLPIFISSSIISHRNSQ